MLIRGSCHCGNLSFTLAWEPDPGEIPARACSCTFCTRHGAVWTSKPDGRLRIAMREPAGVSKYAFGTGTALFHVCARCGIVVVATSEIDGRLYAVVNVNAFDAAVEPLLRRAPVAHDGETLESRLARRQRNWIADVAYA
ncbi:MAG TPA: hypothetical protein VFB32_13050 [Rudaea sp.]|nr:hypothetical protein [Rudaea sp.]